VFFYSAFPRRTLLRLINFVVARLTASLLGCKAELADALAATRVVHFCLLEAVVRRVRVVGALVKFAACESLPALLALEVEGARYKFPVKRLPLNLFLVAQEEHKLIQVPLRVNHVLLPRLPMCINIQLRMGAHLPLALRFSEQRTAINAPQKVLLFIFKSAFELLHVQLAP